MKKKNCIITGGTSGLGLALGSGLASETMGCRVKKNTVVSEVGFKCCEGASGTCKSFNDSDLYSC